MTRAFRIHPADNVATLIEDGDGVVMVAGGEAREIALRGRIALGHKVALTPIAAGEAVVKYGVAIGVATEPIEQGAWVHIHNCRSLVDERSVGFDVHTGAAKDVAYD
jgi:hypothetical protein